MRKGTVYFFTGLAGAGKTTIGGMFYRKLKQIRPQAVLFDGDQTRKDSGHKDYSTEARRNGAKKIFEKCRVLSEQGIDSVYCGIAMYEDVRQWNRENLSDYKEIYIKVSMETLFARDQKQLYSSGARQVVGIDLPWDEPQNPDALIVNDANEDPEIIVERLLKSFGLWEEICNA